jgi:hypothetical protein
MVHDILSGTLIKQSKGLKKLLPWPLGHNQ